MVPRIPCFPQLAGSDQFTGNSNKDHNNQPKVAAEVGAQLSAGERSIVGVMIESNLEGGRQDIPKDGLSSLKKGVSVTDACIDWDDTASTLRRLAASVRARRLIEDV